MGIHGYIFMSISSYYSVLVIDGRFNYEFWAWLQLLHTRGGRIFFVYHKYFVSVISSQKSPA